MLVLRHVEDLQALAASVTTITSPEVPQEALAGSRMTLAINGRSRSNVPSRTRKAFTADLLRSVRTDVASRLRRLAALVLRRLALP